MAHVVEVQHTKEQNAAGLEFLEFDVEKNVNAELRKHACDFDLMRFSCTHPET